MLNNALWAILNSLRKWIRVTPYKLVVGHDALLLVEIIAQPLIIQKKKKEKLPHSNYHGLMLNE